MASFIKLSENKMDYYQFKAKAILLQKKEEKEWQEFCKQSAPECVACLGEKDDVKESKDAAVQTFPKKLQTPSPKTDKAPVQPKYKSEGTLESFIDYHYRDRVDTVMTRIEMLGERLFRLLGNCESHGNKEVPQRNVLYQNEPTIQERNHMPFKPMSPSQQDIKTLQEQRKVLIQNSLKRSIQNFAFPVQKKTPAIKPKYSSFFLPHDLEVKRAASRKAYLASLQTKPKVTFQNNSIKKVSQNKTIKKPNINQKAKTSETEKIVPIKKKVLPENENKKSKLDTEETLVQDIKIDDNKDETIESVVDAVFDDLLGETAFDLNRIRLKKRDIINKANLSVPYNLSTVSSTKCDSSKSLANNNNSIIKLKMFIESSHMIQEENNLRKEPIQLKDKKISTFDIEDSKAMQVKKTAETSTFHRTQQAPKTAPKFICGVKNIIKIDPEKAKNIVSNRDRFWTYLETISRSIKEYNPRILNESLAESILDDCIHDVAEEFNEMTSSFIQNIYNEEFVQQVET